MRRDRDIERVLDRWFLEGPSAMPDRLFEAAFDRIDHVPQRRLVGLQLRFAAMTRTARLAAAAACILALGALGAFALLGGSNVANHPTPSPAVTESPSPTGGPLANGLQQYWIGPPRSIPGLDPAANFAGIHMAGRSMSFDGGSTRPARNDFPSTAVQIGPDHLRFALTGLSAGCPSGAIGNYRFALSPGGGFLTLTPEDDACPARSTALSGEWVESACPNRGDACLGKLEAGEHTSSNFNPFVPYARWTFSYGRFSYTVPDGWQNEEEDRSLYVISKQTAGEDQSIWLLSDEAAHAQAPGCPAGAVDSSVGRTPAALAAWIGSVEGLTTTAPQSVTIGGLSGLSFDVALRATWRTSCPQSAGQPAVALFADVNASQGHDVTVQGATPMRIILLDLGDSRSLLIFVSGKDQATYNALLPEAMPIINSFTFNR